MELQVIFLREVVPNLKRLIEVVWHDKIAFAESRRALLLRHSSGNGDRKGMVIILNEDDLTCFDSGEELGR